MRNFLICLIVLTAGCTGTSGDRCNIQGWQQESSALSYSTIRVKDTPISVMVDTTSDGKMLNYTVTAQSYSKKEYIADIEVVVSENDKVVKTIDRTLTIPSFKKSTITGSYPQGEATMTIEAKVRKLNSFDDHLED